MKRWKVSFMNIIKGLAVPAIGVACFALVFSLLYSLTLLVVSIEEGTGNLSNGAMDMTWATLLLSQGVGIQYANITITLIPLTVTCLLVTMLTVLLKWLPTKAYGYGFGMMAWVTIHGFIAQNMHMDLVDSTMIMILKTASVYLLAVLLASLTSSSMLSALRDQSIKRFPQQVQHVLRLIIRCTLFIAFACLCVALITLIVWIVLGYDNVASIWKKLGMQTGSQIITTIISLGWLPNLLIWALAWTIGATFAIGTVAQFSIVNVNITTIPPIPIFGIFPHSIKDQLQAFVVSISVPTICFIIIMIFLLHPRAFALRLQGTRKYLDYRQMLKTFSKALVSIIMISLLLSVGVYILFTVSNGSLGQLRLKHVGVSMPQGIGVFALRILIASSAAWLFIAGAYLLFWLSRWLVDYLVKRCMPQEVVDVLKPFLGDHQEKLEGNAALLVSSEPRKDSQIPLKVRAKGRILRSASSSRRRLQSYAQPHQACVDNTDLSKNSRIVRSVSSTRKKQ